MSPEPSTEPQQFLALIENSDKYLRRLHVYLRRARPAATWGMILAAIAAAGISNLSPFLSVVCGVSGVLFLVIRINVASALENTWWAFNSLRDLDSREMLPMGHIISLVAHPDPLPPRDEQLLAQVIEDDGAGGTARILLNPFHDVAVVPHGQAPFEVRKGDVVKFHRRGGPWAGIWGKQPSPSTPRSLDA